jgi:prepilin-type N-terminal cleavage/methylation domain-containing protein
MNSSEFRSWPGSVMATETGDKPHTSDSWIWQAVNALYIALRFIMQREHTLQSSGQSLRLRRPCCGNRRGGFTLVELMIVVAIMALLISILGVVTMSMVGSARVAATKATITKVQGLLLQRVDGINSKGPDQTIVDRLAPSFGGRKAAESFARKISFRVAFPQTWAEVPPQLINSLPPGSPPIPASPAPASRPDRQARESSEVLHFMLTKASVLGYPPVGEDAFSSSELSDTDIDPVTGAAVPNGWPELIDAWGKPLRFYRWPTRLVRGGGWAPGGFVPSAAAKLLIPSLPTSVTELNRDPDDSYGFLKVIPPASRPALIPQMQVANYELGTFPTMPMGFPAFQIGPFNTPETYSLPLIVSGGGDLTTGLFEPSDTTVNFGYWGAIDSTTPPAVAPNTMFDNISNYNIRSGGQ